MEPLFFHFTGMDHVIQLKNSYWCWAACLSKIINGICSSSRIGENQCDLATFYSTNFTQIINNNVIYRTDINMSSIITQIDAPCCSKGKITSNKCNVPLHDKDLKALSDYIGLKCDIIRDLSILKEYTIIRKKLIDNDAPIILKTKLRSGRSHMMLITGFGKSSECEYVLVSDPLRASSQYTLLSYFLSENEILNAWEVKLKTSNNNSNLKEDEMLIKNFNLVQKFMIDNKEVMDDDIDFTKEVLILSDKILEPFSKRVILNKMNNEIDINKIIDTIDNQDELPICNNFKKRIKIRRIGNVLSVEKGFNFRDRSLSINRVTEEYFEEFATTILVKRKKGRIMVKPSTFPLNYNLKNEWQEYNSFCKELYKQPKIEYFNTTN